MPEMNFTIAWPNGHQQECYSPSTIIESHFAPGDEFPVVEFVNRARVALDAASERVRDRYGYACSSALEQYRSIEAYAAELDAEVRTGGVVTVVSIAGRRAKPRPFERKSVAVPHTPVIIVGGGQAGLSVSYLLKSARIEHYVFERSEVAHSWKNERWDSFCLVTPNWQCRLPGYRYQGPDPDGFMKKDEIVEFVKGYAQSFDPPLREGVDVKRVSRREDKKFLLETNLGNMTCDYVVVATGGYHEPKVPAFAKHIPPTVTQVHSRDYKSPSQLPEGEVLVVGSGQSGCQIVEDLLLEGRKVHLSLGDAPRVARRYRGKDVVEWLQLMGHYDIPVEEMPDPERARTKTNHYVTGRDGGHDIDLRAWAKDSGLSLYGTTSAYEGNTLYFLPNLEACLDDADATYEKINRAIDEYIEREGLHAPDEPPYVPPWRPESEVTRLSLEEQGITSIVWSIGFGPSLSWVELPVFDDRGYPHHHRGVSLEKGLYFIGLPWLHTWGSGRFCGVARDAEFIVTNIGRLMEKSEPFLRIPAEVPHGA